MNTKPIRERIKSCSNSMNEVDVEALRQKNQRLQDFMLWLIGYLDGQDCQKNEEYKIMLDTLKETKKGQP